MNVYQVKAPVSILVHYDPERGSYRENQQASLIVAAPTAGKAKSEFNHYFNNHWHDRCEYLNIRCRLVLKEAAIEPGVMDMPDCDDCLDWDECYRRLPSMWQAIARKVWM